MSRRREEQDLARVLALSMHDSPHGSAHAGEHASQPRRSPRRADAARSPAAQSHASPPAASLARRRAPPAEPAPTVVEDVFQSRSIPPEARARSQRSTPSKKRTRDRDAMKIGSDVFAAESAEPARSPAPKKGKRTRAADEAAQDTAQETRAAATTDAPEPPTPPADESQEARVPDSGVPTDAAEEHPPPASEEGQEPDTAEAQPPADEPAVREPAAPASEAAGATPASQSTVRGASPTAPLSAQDARRRLFGKRTSSSLFTQHSLPCWRSAKRRRPRAVQPGCNGRRGFLRCIRTENRRRRRNRARYLPSPRRTSLRARTTRSVSPSPRSTMKTKGSCNY